MIAPAEPKYLRNQTSIKVIGCDDHLKIKVTTCKTVKNSNVSEDDYARRGAARCTVNDEKLANNISRAKSAIFDIATCNHWDYFFTGTLDPQKYDRYNLKKYKKDFTQWIRNQSKKLGVKIKYLIVFEKHDDGAWHVHGFIAGLPANELHRFQIGDKMGKYIANKVKKGEEVYNWLAYAEKFGFCDLEPIKNPEATSKYATKYIRKDLAKCVSELNEHMYFCSQGLSRGDVLATGYMENPPEPDFQNDYVAISTYEYSDILLNELLENLVDSRAILHNRIRTLTKLEGFSKVMEERHTERLEALFEADGWEMIPC
ncbi:MAG: hypothetical protein LUH56_06230 [Oscillospiraceae bacterium]|nr:hypothetical protein [Oscillospiraceae bacterium]